MRPASAELMVSLHALHKRPPVDSGADWAHDIENIASENHPIVALSLAPLALHSDPLVANTAARVLFRLLQRLDGSGILWIAREARHFGIWEGSWYYKWAEMRQPDVAQLNVFGEVSVGLLCLGSVHANGYVRQGCVERLANYRGPLPMAFLLLRMNDWVRPVRATARLTVLGRLYEARQGDRARFDELIRNLPLVQNIERWSREDQGPIREAIEATLAAHPLDDLLKQAVKIRVGARQLQLFRRALELHPEARLEIVQRAMSLRNGALRFWAVREAIRGLSPEELHPFIDTLQDDSLAIIRYEAVFALATKLHPNEPKILIPFLLDPSPDVRFLAGYYLEKTKFDVRAHYLENLDHVSGTALAAAIAALGNCGKPGDEKLIARYCEHPEVNVRGAAVFTRGKLQKDDEVSWILVALMDTHKLVVREAARQLEGRVHIIEPRVLDDWMASETRVSMRRQAVRIGAKMERWDALAFLLRVAALGDSALLSDIELEMRRWIQKFVDWYAAPNKQQMRQLEDSVFAARGKVEDSLLNTLLYLITGRQKSR